LFHWHQRRAHRLPEFEKYIQQLVIPKVLRHDAVLSYHDNRAGGAHLGTKRVYGALKLRYYWPGMHQDVDDYVKACDRCQRIKVNRHARPPPLTPLPIPVDTFDR